MFNPKYEYPLEVFSWQHIVALLVVLSVILIVFFCRKLFIKYPLADKIFRYTLVALMLFFELVPFFHNGARSLFSVIIAPYPLCGHLLWFSCIALVSNSERLTKLIYPLAITGSLLSLFVLDMDCTFPHIRAFQFFFTHGCFLLGTLYFVFTKKITKYTLKDLGHSCLFLFGLSAWTLILTNAIRRGDPTANDPYFILNPPGGLEFFKEALGQVGYTIVYVILVALVQLAIYGITKLCTRKRDEKDMFKFEIKQNKFLDYLSKFSNKQRWIYFALLFAFSVYITLLGNIMSSVFLKILDNILFFGLVISIILNEVLYVYKKQDFVKVEIKK